MNLAKLLPWNWARKILPLKRSHGSDGYTFQYDITGFDPKDIRITVSGDTLSLHGEKRYARKKAARAPIAASWALARSTASLASRTGSM